MGSVLAWTGGAAVTSPVGTGRVAVVPAAWSGAACAAACRPARSWARCDLDAFAACAARSACGGAPVPGRCARDVPPSRVLRGDFFRRPGDSKGAVGGRMGADSGDEALATVATGAAVSAGCAGEAA